MGDLIGTIKLLVPGKSYGFIRPDDGSKDVFFQLGRLKTADGAALSDPAIEAPPGHRVRYRLEPAGKIPRALEVTLDADPA